MTDNADSTSAPERLCGWCDHTFPIARRPGRPRIYCNASCRQRAYERRRGLGVLPPPDRIIMNPNGPTGHMRPAAPGYEGGQTSITAGSPTHAMRPAGICDRIGRRLTLCGVLAHPITRRFSTLGSDACLTCAAVEALRPSNQPVRLTADLAALRAIVDEAAIEFSRSERSTHPMRGAGDILADLLERVAGLWVHSSQLAA